MRNLKSKGEKMKFINLLIVAALGVTLSYAKEEVDCSDPKNLPLDIGGTLIGGKKECFVNRGTAARAKRELDMTIGRNPVTGKVTSKAELLGGDKATNDLEKAQMNYGDKKFKLEEAEKAYADGP